MAVGFENLHIDENNSTQTDPQVVSSWGFTPATGNRILTILVHDTDPLSYTGGVSDDQSHTWTQVASISNGSARTGINVYISEPLGATVPTSLSWDAVAAPPPNVVWVIELSGASTSATIGDVIELVRTASAVNVTSLAITGTGTSTDDGSLAVAAVGPNAASGAFGTVTDWTLRSESSQSNISGAVYSRAIDSGVDPDVTPTWATTQRVAGLSFVVRPAAAGGSTVTGVATGAASTAGSASGSTIIEGTATGAATSGASASGVVEHPGVAAGASGSAGTATGLVEVQATASGSASTTATASGLRDVPGTATGATATSGSASGTTGNVTTGTATGSASTTGSATGERIVLATATASATTTADGTGVRIVLAIATAPTSTGAQASALVIIEGTATGATSTAGSASGGQPSVIGATVTTVHAVDGRTTHTLAAATTHALSGRTTHRITAT